MATHLIHREWQTTHCGLGLTEVERVTSTMTLVTCSACFQAQKLLNEIYDSSPEDFEE